jgi:hypothetical protein
MYIRVGPSKIIFINYLYRQVTCCKSGMRSGNHFPPFVEYQSHVLDGRIFFYGMVFPVFSEKILNLVCKYSGHTCTAPVNINN